MPCYNPLHAYQYLREKSNGKKEIVFDEPRDRPSKEIELPCGQCIGCRQSKTLYWATRMQHELITNKNIGCFLTLTYDDKNLPNDYSLNKHHPINFLKKLRKCIAPKKIRYYLAGECIDRDWETTYIFICY